MDVWPQADGICPACGRALHTASPAKPPAPSADREDTPLPTSAEPGVSVFDTAGNYSDNEVSSSSTHAENGTESDVILLAPRAFVTPTIVAVNVAVFLAMIASGASPLSPDVATMLDWGANYGPWTTDGQWWRLLSSTFVHGGILHLAINMWVLWVAGRLVERLLGNIGFAILYILSGLIGSLASLAWNPSSVTVGASGAVFGVVGALVGFLVIHHRALPPEWVRSLRASLGSFLLYNLAFGLVVPGISMAAHVGGLVAGVLCGLALSGPAAQHAAGRRWWRNAAVLVVGSIAVVAGAMALSAAARIADERSQEVDRLAGDFTQLHDRAVATFARLDREARVKRLETAVVADQIEQHVLPLWIECRR
jgi:rhomboid protease GluP